MVVVLLYAHIAVWAVVASITHFEATVSAEPEFDILQHCGKASALLSLLGPGYPWVTEGYQHKGNTLAQTDYPGGHLSESASGVAVDEGDGDVAEESEGQKGGDEAEVWLRVWLQSGPRKSKQGEGSKTKLLP